MAEDKKKKVDKETPKEDTKTKTPSKEVTAKKTSSKKKSKKEEKKYQPKAKPELTPEEKLAMDLRREKKRKTPHFRRQEWFRYKKLGDSWRKPRGITSKMRQNKHNRPKVVSPGFGGPKMAKGRHPSGFIEVMVFRPLDLEGVDPKKQAVRIGHSVGYLKRMHIAIKADELDIRILNFNREAHDELLAEAKQRGIELPNKGES